MIATVSSLSRASLAAPAALIAGVAASYPLAERPRERAVAVLTQAATWSGLAAVCALLWALRSGELPEGVVELASVRLPGARLSLSLLLDGLSLGFAALTFALCGVVGAFADRYLHREEGYPRFFLLYGVFALGMALSALAGNVETLLAGWELVAASSALLIAFFRERPAPARGALRVWTIYRLADGAMLLAAALLHHSAGHGDLSRLPEAGLAAGLLLLFAAACKSGLVPFSGWLPRAMEGPTPSSAIFYGALSVHLGVFLLLRAAPLLEARPALAVLTTALGAVTALCAYVIGGAQTDAKTALCFASLAQVGVITVEIGLGLRGLAFAHLIGNACLRTLQFLRAPSALEDRRAMEDAIGAPRPAAPAPFYAPPGLLPDWAYRFAHERGWFDAALDRVLAALARALRRAGGLERGALGLPAFLAALPAASLASGMSETARAAAMTGIAALAAAAAAFCAAERDLRRWLARAASACALLLVLAAGGAPMSRLGLIALAAPGAAALAVLAWAAARAEGRISSLRLEEHHGLHRREPWAAWAFLAAGLSMAGFPGLPGFLPVELALKAAADAGPAAGAFSALAVSALGFAVMRAYLRIFCGKGGSHAR